MRAATTTGSWNRQAYRPEQNGRETADWGRLGGNESEHDLAREERVRLEDSGGSSLSPSCTSGRPWGAGSVQKAFSCADITSFRATI